MVGAGGTATHLITALVGIGSVCVFDGDKYEQKNISRQHFAAGNIGKFKAQAMVESVNTWAKHKATAVNSYVTSMSDCEGDVIIAVVDNNDARLACKELANKLFIPLIMGMNEEYDPQAYLYLPHSKGTKTDPFVYADIKSDGRDPSRSCTGELDEKEDENNVQTSLANTVAAGFVLAILHSLMVTPEEHAEHVCAKVLGNNNSTYTRTFKQIENE